MLIFAILLATTALIQGFPHTQEAPSDMSIVLITGRGSVSNQMEIINPDNSTKKCQNDYNYPISVRDASGAVVDGNIVVCGGYPSQGRGPTTKQCFVWP